MLRRELAAALICLSLVSCGDGEEVAPTPSEKQRAAEVVNELTAAGLARDGERACRLLAPRGKRLLLRLVQDGAESCAAAIEASSAPGSGGDRDEPVETFSADDVYLQTLRGRPSATVTNRYGAGMALQKFEGEWLIIIPGWVR